MKVIQTKYKGYHFRSRLEARWAVFFDTMGLKWEYEPEGFELKDGTKYLPDFKVDYGNYYEWFEVKSSLKDITKEELLKIIKFQDECGSDLIILDGVPEPKMYNTWKEAFYIDYEEEDYYQVLLEKIKNNEKIKINDSFDRSGYALNCYKDRLWWDEYDNFFTHNCEQYAQIIEHACNKAKSARFEHGIQG